VSTQRTSRVPKESRKKKAPSEETLKEEKGKKRGQEDGKEKFFSKAMHKKISWVKKKNLQAGKIRKIEGGGTKRILAPPLQSSRLRLIVPDKNRNGQ